MFTISYQAKRAVGDDQYRVVVVMADAKIIIFKSSKVHDDFHVVANEWG